MNITIIGSMASAKDMLRIKEKLEAKGNDVVVPLNTDKYAQGNIKTENKKEKIEHNSIKTYFEEIKRSDAILVVNTDKNNIKNYIGGNSLIEMAFAYILNKKIFMLNPIPNISYSDEIEAMMPIIINQDLEKVK